MFEQFMNSNTTIARFLRTVVQGVVSILIVLIPSYVSDIDTSTVSGALVALVMAVLSAIMGAMSSNEDDDENAEIGESVADDNEVDESTEAAG